MTAPQEMIVPSFDDDAAEGRKLAFQWMYWNGLLPAHPMPVPTHMSMTGKDLPPEMHRPY